MLEHCPHVARLQSEDATIGQHCAGQIVLLQEHISLTQQCYRIIRLQEKSLIIALQGPHFLTQLME